MAKKKKTTKQVQVKKTVILPSSSATDENRVDKTVSKSNPKPIQEKQRQDAKVTIKLIPNAPFDTSIKTIGDDPSTYCISFQFTIPNLISYIRNANQTVSTSDCIDNDKTKHWTIMISHNYGERTKQATNQEIYMSLFVRYDYNKSNDPFRYVIVQVDFGNDVNHAHQFTTFPLLFDKNTNSYKFGEVISLNSIFNNRSIALKDGSLSFIIQIKPAPISTLSRETQFILHSIRDDVESVKQYIDEGIDVNCTSSFLSQKANTYLDQSTALIAAANDHANDVVKYLLPLADIYCTNANLENALHRACWSNNKGIVDSLLQEKCPIDKQNVTGITPLMICCIMGYTDLVSLLLKRHANCNCTDNEGNTALHYACSSNHEEIVELLLQQGINLQCYNHNHQLAIDCTEDLNIQIMIITKNQLHSLEVPQSSPFSCEAPFQLSGKCFQDLFYLGINIMKFVATGTDHFPIFPFDLLLPVERLTLIQKLNDCVISQKATFEENILNESLYFACIYVLTKGIITDPDSGKEVPESEIHLRNMILNTYEELYGENLADSGISSSSSHASVFRTIIDLILLSHIVNYSTKLPLFTSESECMSLYHLTEIYPDIKESYFATLPMTRFDEPYLRPLSKHQLSVQSIDGSCKEILYNIVSCLASPKPVKPTAAFSISIEASVVHIQLQFIQKRELTPFELFSPKIDAHNNIYSCNIRTLYELNGMEFKQFWELLPMEKKRMILTLPIKDVEDQIRESVYWFIFRYAIRHWNSIMTNSSLMGIEKNTDTFFISEKNITDETLNRIITNATVYDMAMMPTSSPPSNLFNESFTRFDYQIQDGTEVRKKHLITKRFYMFLSWLFCDNINREFQYHKDEEEANRAAAMVLNENLNEMENTTKSKKKNKKKNKKKEVVVVEKETVERIANYNMGSTFTMTEIMAKIEQEIKNVKEIKKQQEPPVQEEKEKKEKEKEKKEKKEKTIHNEALRITRFLQGEKREKAEVLAAVESKEVKEHTKKSLYSLLHSSNQLFPPFTHTTYSQSSHPSECKFASIIPSLPSFQQSQSYDISLQDDKSEVSLTPSLSYPSLSSTGYDIPGSITPSQLLQYTLRQQLDEPSFSVSGTEGNGSNIPLNPTNSSLPYSSGNTITPLQRMPSFGFNDIGKADGNQTQTTQGRNTNSYYSPSSNRYYMSPNHPY